MKPNKELIQAAKIAVGLPKNDFWKAVEAELARLQPKVEGRKLK